MICRGGLVVSKRIIRVPPVRAGRRVHWTFEVSADVGAEREGRPGKRPKKRRQAKTTATKTKVSRHPQKPVAPEPAPDSQAPFILEGTAAAMTALNEEPVGPATPEPVEPSAALAHQEPVI